MPKPPSRPKRTRPETSPTARCSSTYTGQGYSLKVPEGWARSGTPAAVSFASKLDGLSVNVPSMARQPTPDWARNTYARQLVDNGRAVSDVRVESLKRPAGTVLRISYRVNSEPNPVTSRQVRLEAQRYLFWKKGKLATLRLWAPAGADNVDQWKLMSESFRWQ